MASVRGAVGQAQDMAGEQMGEPDGEELCGASPDDRGQARTALILIGVAVTAKRRLKPPPGKLAGVFRFVSRAVRVVL